MSKSCRYTERQRLTGSGIVLFIDAMYHDHERGMFFEDVVRKGYNHHYRGRGRMER
jgi:hypothetical protein